MRASGIGGGSGKVVTELPCAGDTYTTRKIISMHDGTWERARVYCRSFQPHVAMGTLMRVALNHLLDHIERGDRI